MKMQKIATIIIAVNFLIAAAPNKAKAPADKKEKKESAEGKTVTSSALGEIQTQNAEALKALEGYSYKKAKLALEKAQDIAESAALSNQSELTNTFVLLGVTAIAGSNDLYRGQQYFVRALRQNAKAEIPKSIATLQLNEVMDKAKKTIAAVGKSPTIKLAEEKAQEEAKAAEAAKLAQVRGLQHSPIETVKAKMPVPMRAEAGADIQAHALYLFYRAAGTVDFSRATMEKNGNVWRAEVPASIVKGKYFHYYIEARDQRERLTATNGSARNPNVVTIQ